MKYSGVFIARFSSEPPKNGLSPLLYIRRIVDLAYSASQPPIQTSVYAISEFFEVAYLEIAMHHIFDPN